MDRNRMLEAIADARRNRLPTSPGTFPKSLDAARGAPSSPSTAEIVVAAPSAPLASGRHPAAKYSFPHTEPVYLGIVDRARGTDPDKLLTFIKDVSDLAGGYARVRKAFCASSI